MTKYLYHDGQKAGVLDDTPGLWTYYSNAPQQTNDVLYARVAAAFRAFNLKANTIGNMPFTLVDLKSGEEYDNSATWENKVKFLPYPSEVFRLDTLSYMASNTIYNLMTKDVLGRKEKRMRNAIPSAFVPQTNAAGNVEYIERRTGTTTERYSPATGQMIGGAPTSPRLIYMWRMDHTTEELPSQNTEAQAVANAAGIIYSADVWIHNFFARGGVVPMIIAMKGMVPGESKDEREKSWTNWYLGLRSAFKRVFRIVNADALDVKRVGSGIEQLKDNVTYNQSIANIAMVTGMPLSLLLSNSANYATAKEEKATWYENDIIPLCNWLAYGYNEQVFHPMGLHLKFHPETLDPQQEDETQRAQAFSTYGDAFSKYPTYGLWRGMVDTLGLEVTDNLDDAAQKYYAEKEKEPEPLPPAPQAVPEQEQPEEADDEMEQEVEPEPKTEKKAFDNSSMIALRIPDVIRKEIATRYSFVDSETLDNLHITLVYLGDNRTLDKLDIVRAVSDFGMYQSPIKGMLQGLARFVSGSDRDPLVCTFDSPQMPGAYNILTGALDNYSVPYHKDHGFIPHMTLAYIPADGDMPIETIEPIEINFSEVYYVDGNVWYPVDLVGYENKTAVQTAQWLPSLDELEELRVYREVAMRRHKKGKSLAFDYEPHHGGLPVVVMDTIKAKLATASTADEVEAAFDLSAVAVQPVQTNTELMAMAAAMNNYVEVEWAKLKMAQEQKG